MTKKLPEISLSQAVTGGAFDIKVGKRTHTVDYMTMANCFRDLNFQSNNDFFIRFKEVCEWFIKQDQYVQFTEVK